jgi:excisionase family DNA binding protein
LWSEEAGVEGQEHPDGSSGTEPTKFFTRREVAALFGVSASTVTRWAQKGLLKTVRTPGGHYRFPAKDAERLAQGPERMQLLRLD